LYESTVDVLYNLYDKLSVGGFIIMDDWFGFPSRTAVEDFHNVHQIELKVETIDALSVYFKKEKNITVQYWRYLESKFK
jgi:O-methyltransferase